MSDGWIKLDRKMLDWEWMDDPYMVAFWVRLLLRVNTKDKKWHGRVVRRGQLLTSIRRLENCTGWSHHTIQRILRDLQDTGEIEVVSNKEGTLITVVNFSKYQDKGVAVFATPSATPSATNLRINKEEKEEKNINPPTPTRVCVRKFDQEAFGTFGNVFLKAAEHRTLRETYGTENAEEAIEDLSCKLADGTTESANHYATLRYWLAYQRDHGRKPADTSSSASKADRVAELRRLWDTLSPQEQQQHLNDNNGVFPWDDPKFINQ